MPHVDDAMAALLVIGAIAWISFLIDKRREKRESENSTRDSERCTPERNQSTSLPSLSSPGSSTSMKGDTSEPRGATSNLPAPSSVNGSGQGVKLPKNHGGRNESL